jgi:hypothetical protein
MAHRHDLRLGSLGSRQTPFHLHNICASNTCASPKCADGILSRGRCDETTTTLTTKLTTARTTQKTKACFHVVVVVVAAKRVDEQQRTANSATHAWLWWECVVFVCVSFVVATTPSCSRHQEGALRITSERRELSLVELVNAHDSGRSCATL